MSLSLTHGSSFNSSNISTLSQNSCYSSQQSASMQATMLLPIATTLIANWSFSLFSQSDLAMNTGKKANELCKQVIQGLGDVFSYFTSNANEKTKKTTPVTKGISISLTPSCAFGVLALGSGQSAIQMIGMSILANCIQFPVVQANNTFLKTVSLNGNVTPVSLTPAPDGGTIVGGQIYSTFNVGELDSFITKFDPNNGETWTIIFGGTHWDGVFAVETTPDKGYLTGGFTHDSGVAAVWQTKFFQNGTKNWTKTSVSPWHEGAYSLKVFPNGNSVMAGFTTRYSTRGFDVLLQMMDSAGNPIWSTTTGGPGNDLAKAVIIRQTGGTAVAGSTQSATGDWNCLIEIFNSSGDLTCAVIVGENGDDGGTALTETQDGGIAVLGSTNSYGGKNKILVVKINHNCDREWASTLEGVDNATGLGITERPDRKFLITGSVSGYSEGSGLIAELTSDGASTWAQIHGDKAGFAIRNTTDGRYIVTGATYNTENHDSDSFLFELDENAQIQSCGSKFITLIYENLTDILPFTPFLPTIAHPIIPFNNVAMTFNTLRMNQTQLCPKNTTSASPSAAQSQSNSLSAQLSKSLLPSFSHSLPRSLSQSMSKDNSLSRSQSAKRSDSRKISDSHSEDRTRTKPRTKTRAVRLRSSTVIEQSKIPLPGVIHIHLSPSGSLVLSQVNGGYQLVKINQAGTMVPAGRFNVLRNPRASAFSRNEKYVFVANDQGVIQVVDISYPDSPLTVGSFSVGYSIESLDVSGSGEDLLVGTNVGVLVFSVKTPDNIGSIGLVTTYPTADSVTSIQANPNTNTVAVGLGKNVTLLDYVNRNLTVLDEKTLSGMVKSIAPVDQVAPGRLTCTLNNQDIVLIDIAGNRFVNASAAIPGVQHEVAALSGSTMLVADVKQGIQIFENEQENWLNAREVGYNPIANVVTDLVFSLDGRFAVYSDSEGLKLIKIVKNPGRLDVPLPRLANVVKRNFPITCSLVNDVNNWIAVGGNNRLEFLAKDNLQNPSVLGHLNTTGNVRQMAFFPDQTRLLLSDDSGISCIDCFNPGEPKVLSRWSGAGILNRFTLVGSHVYVCQGEKGVVVLDATNMSEVTRIPTLGAAQDLLADRSLFYVADSSGIDIWSMTTPLSFQKVSRLNETGLVSRLALNETDKMLYFASGQYLGKANVSDATRPILLERLDTTYPIKDIALSRQGGAGYLAVEINGMLAIDAEKMQIKGTLPSTHANSLDLPDSEDQIYVSNEEGGLQIADLLTELPIIALTARDNFPVGVQEETSFSFFSPALQPVKIDRINEIRYIDQGQKKEIPDWISADLKQGKLLVTAPKELTDKTIQLAISVDVNGVRQETIYEAKIVTSLGINTDKGAVSITTPSNIATAAVELIGGSFIPLASGPLAVSVSKNTLQASGPVSAINDYLASVRINPSPISAAPSTVELNAAQLTASDIVNLFPSHAVARLRSFRFNKPPVVVNPLDQINKKALESFEVTVPSDTFFDPDDFKLTLSAKLANGKALPSWLTFNPETGIFNGYAPPAMLNQTLPITLTATDGYLSVDTSWKLHIDANHGPFVAKVIPPQTYDSSSEFTYRVPKDIFQDLDNNTLTYSAVQVGYDVLPSFLTFDPDTCTFLGRPQASDVNPYSIQLTATDKFGATASVIFDLKIQYSWADLYKNLHDNAGYIAGVVTPITVALGAIYINRAFLYNVFKRKKYWRNEIPEDLLKGKEYKPKCPITEEELKKDDIAKIRILRCDNKKYGHDCTKDHLPTHFFVSLYSNTLLNDAPLPTWLELNPDTGALTLKKEHFPSQNHTYVYQVIGKNDRILESFFIQPMSISTYEAPINLWDFDLNAGSIVQQQGPQIDIDRELQELMDRRPNSDPDTSNTARQQALQRDIEDLQEIMGSRPGEVPSAAPATTAAPAVSESPPFVSLDEALQAIDKKEQHQEDEGLRAPVTLKRTREFQKAFESKRVSLQ